MKLKQKFQSLLSFGKQVIKDYSLDNGGLVAAAVSYYVFLSAIPLLLLAVAVLGFILGSPEHARTVVFSYIREYSPALGERGGTGAADIVEGIVRGRGVATGFGLLALLWTGTSVLSIFEQAINVAWDVTAKRSFIKKRLLALVMMLLVGLLLGLSVGVTAGFSAIKNLNISVFGIYPRDLPFIWQLIGYLVPFLVTLGMFTLIYKVLPNMYVPVKVALVGAVFSSVMWKPQSTHSASM